MKRKKTLKILIILGTIFAIFISTNFNRNFYTENFKESSVYNDKTDVGHKNLKISVISDPIYIDNNWSAAVNEGICTGEGTKSKPYVIQNLVIDAKNSTCGIFIRSFDVYFTIKNCKVYNSAENYPGIYIYAHNGLVTNNNVSNNQDEGILVSGSNNTISKNIVNDNSYGIVLGGLDNIISGNTANNNYGQGIYVSNGDNNIIIENTVDNNWNGIVLYHSEYNIVSENIESNNGNCGILSGWGYYNEISGNIARRNGGDGIKLISSDYNEILEGTFNNNSGYGIDIHSGHANIISRNIISQNIGAGLHIDTYSSANNITLNCFINNTINAYEESYNINYWDDGNKGNYWSDYTGSDLDEDGIGDVPYNISGYLGSQDNFPLMQCPISTEESGGGFLFVLIILISSIGGGAVIALATVLLIMRKRKRIE